MPTTFLCSHARRFGAAGLLMGGAVASACGGKSDAANTPAQASAVPTADTATLSAQAVAIGGFFFDTARRSRSASPSENPAIREAICMICSWYTIIP